MGIPTCSNRATATVPPSAPRLSKRALQGANQAAAHDLTRGAIYPRSAKTPNFCARLKKKVQQSNDEAQIYIQPIAPFAAHGTNQQNFKEVIVIFSLMPSVPSLPPFSLNSNGQTFASPLLRTPYHAFRGGSFRSVSKQCRNKGSLITACLKIVSRAYQPTVRAGDSACVSKRKR